MLNESEIKQHWLERGKTYYQEKRLDGQFYKDQEALFLHHVTALNPHSIIDIGCGFGRITKVLAAARPWTQVLGTDISQRQLTEARTRCSILTNVNFLEHDICSEEPLPRRFDVATCAEVLLHYPDDITVRIIGKILNSAKVLVHEVDLNWKKEDHTNNFCFWHDYEKIYRDLGLFYILFIKGNQAIATIKKPS